MVSIGVKPRPWSPGYRRAHALAHGLVLLAVPNGKTSGGLDYDLVRGRIADAVSHSVPHGVTPAGAGNGSAPRWDGYPLVAPASLCAVFTGGNDANDWVAIANDTGGVRYGLSLKTNPGGATILDAYYRDSGGVNALSSSVALDTAADGINVACCSVNAAETLLSVWCNGGHDDKAITGISPSMSRIAYCGSGSGGDAWPGKLLMLAVLRREISNGDAQAFMHDPWELIRPPRTIVHLAGSYVAPAASRRIFVTASN